MTISTFPESLQEINNIFLRYSVKHHYYRRCPPQEILNYIYICLGFALLNAENEGACIFIAFGRESSLI